VSQLEIATVISNLPLTIETRLIRDYARVPHTQFFLYDAFVDVDAIIDALIG